MPVSSFLHISSSCSGDSYWRCHLSALSAFEPPGSAALHSLLPGRHAALHELHRVLPQCLKDVWWSWNHQTPSHLLATSGEVCLHSGCSIFSKRDWTGGLSPLFWWSGKFEPAKPNPIARSMSGSLLIAFKMWIGNWMSPLLPANGASWVFLKFYVLEKKILRLCLLSPPRTLFWKLHFCVFPLLSLHLPTFYTIIPSY